MKLLATIVLLVAMTPIYASTVDDLQSIIATQQAQISEQQRILTDLQNQLNTLKQDTSSLKQDTYRKSDSDSRYLQSSASDQFMKTYERSQLQKKLSLPLETAVGVIGTNRYTCSCNQNEIAFTAGLQAWGGDSIKELYAENQRTWKATCIDHDKSGGCFKKNAPAGHRFCV